MVRASRLSPTPNPPLSGNLWSIESERIEFIQFFRFRSVDAAPYRQTVVSRHRRAYAVILCIAVLWGLCISIPLRAQTVSASSEEEYVQQLIAAGDENYEIKNYREASALYRQAYTHNPVWTLWYSIAQAESGARNFGLALEAYEKYMAMGGDQVPDDRVTEVVNEVRLLRELVGRIEVEDAPSGAEIYVDDTLRGTVPLTGELRVTASVPHQVDIVLYGAVIHSQPLTVGSAGTVVIRLKAKKAPSVKPLPPAPHAVPFHAQNKPVMPNDNGPVNLKPLQITFFTSAALTVLAGGATAIFWGLAGKKNDELDNLNRSRRINGNDVSLEEMYNLKDQVEQFDTMTTAALISTVALATITTISGVLLLKKHRQQKSAVSVVPGAVTMRF